MSGKIDPISLKLGWARLLALVDDSAATLIRGAFSSLVREMHDFVVAIFDAQGRLIATSSLGSPGLAGTLPNAVKHFVETFPAEGLQPGDVLATNDPWIATGHLNDISVAQPIFHGGAIVGWAGCTVHVEDIGGIGPSINAREVFEEGLYIPPCKIVEAGQPNELFFGMLRAAVRTPDSVLGDVRSQIAAAGMLSRKMPLLLDALGWPDLQGMADDLLSRTERSTREAIGRIPDGQYRNSMLVDSYKAGVDPLTLSVCVSVEGDRISLDFTGTSAQVAWGINAPLNTVRGYGFFPLKCILDPATPLNDGFIRTIALSAPEGCLVNALRPAPVWGRLVIGYFLPELIFEALAPAIPDRVVAGSGSVPMWANFFDSRTASGARCITIITPQGGMGARSFKDGVSTMAWPGNLAMLPIEVLEHQTGLDCEAMELTTDSGGPGRYRGGLGQRLVLSVPQGARAPAVPINASLRGARLRFSGKGFLGGHSTPLGKLLVNGDEVTKPGVRELAPGDRLTYLVPGGAGFEDPRARDPHSVADDVRDGYVSAEGAKRDYRVALTRTGDVDDAGTARLRAGGT